MASAQSRLVSIQRQVEATRDAIHTEQQAIDALCDRNASHERRKHLAGLKKKLALQLRARHSVYRQFIRELLDNTKLH